MHEINNISITGFNMTVSVLTIAGGKLNISGSELVVQFKPDDTPAETFYLLDELGNVLIDDSINNLTSE